MHAIWYRMLNTLGIFDISVLTDIERLTYAEKRHYFWLERWGWPRCWPVCLRFRSESFIAGRTEITLAFISGAVLFLPFFVFLPKLMQQAMKTDVDAVIDGVREKRIGEESLSGPSLSG